MAANRELLDAFNDCIDRMSLGQNIEAVLGSYPPRLAGQLRPMLEASLLARRASQFPNAEVLAARERSRAKVLAALEGGIPARPPSNKVIRFPTRRTLTAVAAITVIALAVAFLLPRPDTPADTPTPTPTHTEMASPTHTATASPSATMTITNTVTASPSATMTITNTATASPSATMTITNTVTPTPSPSITPTQPASTSSASATSTVCVPTQPDGWVKYRVRSGDTLSALAVNTGTTLERLQTVNCIADPRSLRVDQDLFVPRRPTTTGGGGSTTDGDDDDDDDQSSSGGGNTGDGDDDDDDDGGGGGDDDDDDDDDDD